MFLPIILGLAGLGFLVLLAMIAYGSWIAHKMTVMERVSLDIHPTTLGLSCEDVEFPSRGDEVPLSGWYLPAAQDDRCVILIQGTHHHRNDPQIRALRLGRDLVEGGFSVLLFDFRARGESGETAAQRGTGDSGMYSARSTTLWAAEYQWSASGYWDFPWGPEWRYWWQPRNLVSRRWSATVDSWTT